MFDVELYSGLRQFDCLVAGEAMDVYEIDINEGLFSDFEASITLVFERRITIRDYVGKDALLTVIGKGHKDDRYVHGMIRSMEELAERGRFYLYKIVVVPYVWRLSQMSDIRIFQHKTVPEIITEVLEGSGILSIQYEFRTQGKYAPREYCVQYRETNLAFIKRLMAEEGMFHYHEFTQSEHILVIGDSFICHNTMVGNSASVIFSPKGQLVNEFEFVTTLDAVDAMTTGKISLTDYHFQTPSYTPHSQTKSDLYNDLEHYDYPGYIADPKTGDRLATMELERRAFKRLTFEGTSVCRRLVPGHRFSLSDHYNQDMNREYTVVSIHHYGKQPQSLQELGGSSEGNSFGNTFVCIPSEVSFHPDPMAKPSVTGVQTARVTGPETEEIFTDEYGRIKVQFHWDRLDQPTDKTSCWMRVAQSWAGSGWGSIFIPRVGQEVIVNFIDGDPDRPIVTGAVYNGRNMPPYALPAEKTKSTIKTNSTIGGGGFNEIRFEDKKAQEEIYIHGEKDWNIDILNDKGQTIGHDETMDVKNDRTKSVGNDQKESIGNNKDITVAKNHTESIGEDSTHAIGKNSDETVGENKTVDIGKNRKERIGEDSTINIGKNATISVGENTTKDTGKNHTETIGMEMKLDVGDGASISIGKDYSLMVGKKTVVSSQDQITFECGQASIIMKKDGKIQISGVDIKISASGAIVTKGQSISGN